MGIYPFDVLVFLGTKPEEVTRYLSKRYGINNLDVSIFIKPQGKLITFESGSSVLWTREVPKRGSALLAHEIFHAVCNIMVRTGIPLTEESEEAYAYAIQFLTNKINEKL